MGRLIAFLVMAVLTSPAWAACPSTLSDCTSTPVYSVVTGWQGVLGGPWTTGTRPANPANGLMGFNTTLGAYEYYNGSWAQLPALDKDQTFSGLNGFTSATASALVPIATGSSTARSLATRYAEIYNVLDNGVVCDGNTNGIGTDNVLALKALVTRASANATTAHRVAIYFPPCSAHYLVGSTFYAASYVDFIADVGTAVIAPTAAWVGGVNSTSPSDGLLFNVEAATDVLIKGLTFDGGANYPPFSARAISAMTWSGGVVTVTAAAIGSIPVGQFVFVSGVTPSGYDGAYAVTSSSTNQFTYALAGDPGAVTVQGTAQRIFNLQRVSMSYQTTNTTWQDNTFQNAFGNASEVEDFNTSLSFTNNTYSNVGNLFRTFPCRTCSAAAIISGNSVTDPAKKVSGFLAAGNYFKDVGADLIAVKGAVGFQILNNKADLNASDRLILNSIANNVPNDSYAGDGTDGVISGNRVTNSFGLGLAYSGSNITISANDVASSWSSCILVQGANISIDGNVLSNCTQGTASGFVAQTWNAGVTIEGLSTNISVGANQIADSHVQYVHAISGSAILTGFKTTSQFTVGDAVTCSDCQSSSVILSIDSLVQITLDKTLTGTNTAELVTVGTPTMQYAFQGVGIGGPPTVTGTLVNVNIKQDNAVIGASTAIFEPAGTHTGDVTLNWGWNYGGNVIAGVTGSIGGGALSAGQCASGTATVSGATSGMRVTATPNGNPLVDANHGLSVLSYVSSANTITVNVCAILATTPNALTYGVQLAN